MIKKFIIGIVLALLVGGIAWKFLPSEFESDLLNPLGWQKWVEKSEGKMEVVGFLPTWMIGKTASYDGEIDQLIFSGIEVNTDGSLMWDIQSKKINNEAYLQQKNKIKRSGGKNIVSIKLFKDKELEKLIVDRNAKDKLIREVAALVKSGGFDGVNIDFEYMSNPIRITNDDFVEFFKETKLNGWGEVGVDVFANTIIKGSGERINKLAKAVDWIVVMAYDFHRPGSDYAGSVAPIEAEPGQRSIKEVVDKIVVSAVDPKKIVLAYPLYGYEWVTVDDSYGSAQVNGGYGRTVFYTEGVGITGSKWDEKSMNPWVAWRELQKKSRVVSQRVGKKIVKKTEYYYVSEWHQAHYENERSLKIKIDMALASKVGGVGYWALGYEGKNSGLMVELDGYIKNRK